MALADRFVRWQGQAIAQLSFAINLFLGFAVTALAFTLSFLRESSFTPSRCYAFLYLLSLVLLSAAALCGIGAVVTRLLDFRATANKVRLRQQYPISAEIAVLGDYATGLGKATWRLFWFMLGGFTLGIACFAISFFSVYGERVLRAAGL